MQAAAADAGVRAGRARAQPPAAPSGRCSSASASPTRRSARSTRSRSPSTARTPTPRSSRSATACSPTASRSTSPTTRERDARARSLEEFALAVLRRRDVDPAAGHRPAPGRRTASCGEALTERRGAPRRGPRGRARRQAPASSTSPSATRAGARPGEAEGRAPPPAARRGARRPAGRAEPRRPAAAHRVLRHLEPHGHPPGRLDGRLRGRRAEEERLPPLPHPRQRGGRPRRLRRDGRGAGAAPRAAGSARPDLSPHDPERDASLRGAAEPHRHRRRPRASSRPGCASLQGFRERGVAVISLAKRIEEVFLPGDPRAAASCATTRRTLQLLQRVRDEAHRFAITHHRGRRDRAMTASVLDDLPGRRAGAQARAPRPLRLARGVSWPPRARSSRRCPGCPAKVARELWGSLHKTGV